MSGWEYGFIGHVFITPSTGIEEYNTKPYILRRKKEYEEEFL
jgi:hypothetical protein